MKSSTLLIIIALFTDGESAETENFSLLDSVWPMYYKLSLSTHLDTCRESPNNTCPFQGSVAIYINITEPISQILIHSYPNIEIKESFIKYISKMEEYNEIHHTSEDYKGNNEGEVKDEKEKDEEKEEISGEEDKNGGEKNTETDDNNKKKTKRVKEQKFYRKSYPAQNENYPDQALSPTPEEESDHQEHTPVGSAVFSEAEDKQDDAQPDSSGTESEPEQEEETRPNSPVTESEPEQEEETSPDSPVTESELANAEKIPPDSPVTESEPEQEEETPLDSFVTESVIHQVDSHLSTAVTEQNNKPENETEPGENSEDQIEQEIQTEADTSTLTTKDENFACHEMEANAGNCQIDETNSEMGDSSKTSQPSEGEEGPNGNGKSSTSAELSVGDYNRKTQILTLKLSRTLKPGIYKLLLTFETLHGKKYKGFFFASYETATTKSYLLGTQFKPDRARRAFPCFEEPRFKAKFEISVDISKTLYDEGYHVLSNMPIELIKNYNSETNNRNQTLEGEERVVFKFQKVPFAIPTYLVAFVVSDFVGSDPIMFDAAKGCSKALRTWVPKSLLEEGERTYNMSEVVAPIFLEFFTDLYNMSYPLPKLDQVAIPNFSTGAMEHWGLIIYRAEVLMPKPTDPVENQMNVIFTLAHELVHQWFGNLITIKSWDDVWLNEGFASFHQAQLGRIHHDDIETEPWDSVGRFVSVNLQNSLIADSFEDSPALSSPAKTPRQINAKFSPITYGKGGSVIRMWKLLIGDEIFFGGVSDYLLARQFQDGSVEALANAIDETLKCMDPEDRPHFPTDIHSLFADWYRTPGYPVLKVKRVAAMKIMITQERFLLKSRDQESSKSSRWYIPLTMATNVGANFDAVAARKFFIKGDSVAYLNMHGEPAEWYVINNQAAGFYRVLYEKENYDALKNTLKDLKRLTNIHQYNRAQIIDDSFAFAIMDVHEPYLRLADVLNTTTYMVNERHFVPWRAFIRNIRLLIELLSNPETGDQNMYKAIKKYTRAILRKRLKLMLTREKLLDLENAVIWEELIQLKNFLKFKGARAMKTEISESTKLPPMGWEELRVIKNHSGIALRGQRCEVVDFVRVLCQKTTWC